MNTIIAFLEFLVANHLATGKSAGWKPAEAGKSGGVQITSKHQVKSGSIAIKIWDVVGIIFSGPFTIMVNEYLSIDAYAAIVKGESEYRTLRVKIAKCGRFIDLCSIRVQNDKTIFIPSNEGETIAVDIPS